MPIINFTLQDANAHRKKLEFQKANNIYQTLWEKDPDQFNEWAGWSYAFCLSKMGKHKQALNICRFLYPRFPHSEFLNSLYARCIYYSQFTKEPQPGLETLRKAVSAMCKLCGPHIPYSFTSIAIFKLIKALQAQQQIDWEEIQDWLIKMEPDLLDAKPFLIEDKSGRKTELASPQEQWYAGMIKAKAGLNQPTELLELLDTARKKNIKWHYNNDIWFARKEAFALKQLGEREKAENILRKILLQKRDWYLIYDLAQMVENKEETLELMCSAVLAPGKNEMKIKLFENIYHEIKDIPEINEEAALHLCMILALREENDWPQKAEMSSEIERRGFDIHKQGSSLKIKERLLPFWKSRVGDNNNRHEGVISQILPNGVSAFVKAGLVSYYTSLKDVREEIKTGTKVSFELVDSFDRKKNKPSKMAVKIRVSKK